jgi:hypothetical protein
MKRLPRYLLLPVWIRVFAWIFLVMGVPGAIVAVLGLIFNFTFPMFIFGLRSVGPLRSPVTFVIGATFALLAYAAFALLWGREDGRRAGLAAGYIGLVICAVVSFATFASGGFYIPFEPLLQVPFIWKLHKLKGRWEEPNPTPEPATMPVTAPAGQEPRRP